MTDLAALDALIEAVTAGQEYLEREIQDAFGGYRRSATSQEIIKEYRGSLDAARPLHKALKLEAWAWAIDSMGQALVWYPWVEGDSITFEAVDAENPARAELEADNWSRDYRALEKAVCGDTGLSAMLIATQAMLFKPRAEAAEARVAELTAKLSPFALLEFEATDEAWAAFYQASGHTWIDYDHIANARAALIGGE